MSLLGHIAYGVVYMFSIDDDSRSLDPHSRLDGAVPTSDGPDALVEWEQTGEFRTCRGMRDDRVADQSQAGESR